MAPHITNPTANAMARFKHVHMGIRIFFATFWVVALAWLFYSMQARGFDPSILESDDDVRVRATDEMIRFAPVTDSSTAGLIFYPGALVDPDAYAPFARAIAEAGYPVTIVKVPFRLDLFDWQWEAVVARTQAVRSADASRAWIVGGHSRGGMMAARLAGKRPDWFDGLLLVGTSHPRDADLSHLQLDVVKVYGSEDGLATEAEVKRFAPNLPSETRFVRMDGGNHRQFGYYGWQLGDGRATIDRETQLRETVEAALAQLASIEQK